MTTDSENENDGANGEPPAEPTPRRSGWRVFFRVIGIILIVLVVVFIIGLMMLSAFLGSLGDLFGGVFCGAVKLFGQTCT